MPVILFCIGAKIHSTRQGTKANPVKFFSNPKLRLAFAIAACTPLLLVIPTLNGQFESTALKQVPIWFAAFGEIAIPAIRRIQTDNLPITPGEQIVMAQAVHAYVYFSVVLASIVFIIAIIKNKYPLFAMIEEHNQKLPSWTNHGFVLCGWLPFCKSLLVIDFVRSGLVFGLFARRTWPLALMVSTNQVPFRTSNSKRSGQSTGCLGFRADKVPSLHWSCNLLLSVR